MCGLRPAQPQCPCVATGIWDPWGWQGQRVGEPQGRRALLCLWPTHSLHRPGLLRNSVYLRGHSCTGRAPVRWTRPPPAAVRRPELQGWPSEEPSEEEDRKLPWAASARRCRGQLPTSGICASLHILAPPGAHSSPYLLAFPATDRSSNICA